MTENRVGVTILIIGILAGLTLALDYYWSQPHKSSRKPSAVSAAREIFSSGTGSKIPESDAPGAKDIPGVPRPPDSKIVWAKDTSKAAKTPEAKMLAVKYISSQPPASIEGFYQDHYFGSEWRQVEKRPIGFDGRGYFCAYRNFVTNEGMVVFAIADVMDEPLGSEQNPTNVNLLYVGQKK